MFRDIPNHSLPIYLSFSDATFKIFKTTENIDIPYVH